MQPQPTVDVLVVDIAQKIFISRDAQRGRAAAPLDLKSAIGLNFGKIGNLSRVGHDVTVAHDTAPAATAGGQEQRGQGCDRCLIHNSTVADETRLERGLDSGICAYAWVAFAQSAAMDDN